MTKLSSTLLFVFLWVSGHTYAQERVENIILLIGDGMGMAQLSAAWYYSEAEPSFAQFPYTGLVQTSSGREKITDSAAGATAMSTGQSTYNKAIGVDLDTLPRETLVERFARQGKRCGLIATSSITHATPAAFYAHVDSRHKPVAIAGHMADAPVDFFAGGGARYFSDSLCEVMALNGWYLNLDTNFVPRPKTDASRQGYLLAPDGMARISAGRGDYLPRATAVALEHLQDGRNGFFLMVEGSQIDWAGHANDGDYLVEELLDFEGAVGVALRFAREQGNTLVLVTADHETGGYSLSGKEEKVPFQGTKHNYREITPTFSTGGHSAAMVPLLAYGPGAAQFTGIYHLTDIHQKILALTGAVSGD